MNFKPSHSPVTGHVVLTADLLTFNATEVAREDPSSDDPLFCLQFKWPLPSGQWPIVLEGFGDGSWAAYFEADPSIISGSNDNWMASLHNLMTNASDELQTIREYGDNITSYMKNRRSFLEKVFRHEF